MVNKENGFVTVSSYVFCNLINYFYQHKDCVFSGGVSLKLGSVAEGMNNFQQIVTLAEEQ